jgi:hypothetical protein
LTSLALAPVAPFAQAEPTTAQATTAPTTQERRAQMHEWFAALAHRDPTEREAARLSLMSLERDDLPELKKLVQSSMPLAPSQAAALHDIVAHVFLTGEPYVKSTQAFLGVNLGASLASIEGEETEENAQPQKGVIIVDRFPGFCGYRALQNGDVILSIKERPEVNIQTVPDFQAAIMTSRAGTIMHFEVIRKMRVIEVEIKLDARPNGSIPEELNIRDKDAQEYWDREFAPLVSGGVS